MNPSTALGRVLVDELVRCGVQEAVLAPGSRSAPLALALPDADAPGRRRVPAPPERGRARPRAAGGRAVVAPPSRRPAPTLPPPVRVGSEPAVPLLVITADRPPEL